MPLLFATYGISACGFDDFSLYPDDIRTTGEGDHQHE